MSILSGNKTALNNLQLELLKCLKHLASEQQVAEVKCLLRYYFVRELDVAINKIEAANNYSAVIYEGWLNSSAGNDNS